MIQVKNLVKKYNNHLALNNLSFQIEDNQVFGFLGPNGAGKSTTMNILTGYLSATEGQVMIDGCDITKNPIETKKMIGYLPEIPPLYMDMTPYEYLKFVCDAKKIDKYSHKVEIEKSLEKTGLNDVKDRLIKTLSKGYRQRVGMAQAIIGNPKVIILDEPTVGLDPIQIIEFRKLINDLGKNHTVIISSHILAEISEICNKIMIISKGNLIAIDTPEKLSDMLEGEFTVEVKLRITDFERLKAKIKELDFVKSVKVGAEIDRLLKVHITGYKNDESFVEKLSVFLMNEGCPIMEMITKKMSLEDIYITMLKKEN